MSDAMTKIEELVASGDTIQAIKMYREVYGASLKDGKAAIDAIKEGRLLSESRQQAAAIDRKIDEEISEELYDLIKNKQTIAAIKLYRELSGESLKEAKMTIALWEESISKRTSKPTIDELIPQRVLQNPHVPTTEKRSFLPADHPISSLISERNWQILWNAQGIYNLEEGVLLLDAAGFHFWALRFDEWTEHLQVQRHTIHDIDMTQESDGWSVLLRYEGGTARIRKLSMEAGQALQELRASLITTHHSIEQQDAARNVDNDTESSKRQSQGGLNWWGLLTLLLVISIILKLADYVIGF